MQGIGIEGKVRILQTDTVVENGQFGGWRVLTIEGRELVQRIDNHTPFKIVADIGNAFIVQAVGKKGDLSILHPDIVAQMGNLRVTIIMQVIAINKKGITLFHAYMAESLQRVAFLKEIGTVAIHIGTVVTETNLSHQHLGIGVLCLIERERVGMFQIDLGLAYRIGRCWQGKAISRYDNTIRDLRL